MIHTSYPAANDPAVFSVHHHMHCKPPLYLEHYEQIFKEHGVSFEGAIIDTLHHKSLARTLHIGARDCLVAEILNSRLQPIASQLEFVSLDLNEQGPSKLSQNHSYVPGNVVDMYVPESERFDLVLLVEVLSMAKNWKNGVYKAVRNAYESLNHRGTLAMTVRNEELRTVSECLRNLPANDLLTIDAKEFSVQGVTRGHTYLLRKFFTS